MRSPEECGGCSGWHNPTEECKYHQHDYIHSAANPHLLSLPVMLSSLISCTSILLFISLPQNTKSGGEMSSEHQTWDHWAPYSPLFPQMRAATAVTQASSKEDTSQDPSNHTAGSVSHISESEHVAFNFFWLFLMPFQLSRESIQCAHMYKHKHKPTPSLLCVV